MLGKGRMTAFLDSRRVARWSLGICLLSLALWAYSAKLYYRPLPPPTVACRLPGVLLQVCSQQGALHWLVMREEWDANSVFALERLTYLGNGGYGHGAVGAFGFVLAFLPTTHNGGDYTVAPHVAMVIPYWFLAALSGAIYLQWFCRRERSKEAAWVGGASTEPLDGLHGQGTR